MYVSKSFLSIAYIVYFVFMVLQIPSTAICQLRIVLEWRFQHPIHAQHSPAARTPGGHFAAGRAFDRRPGSQDPSGRTIVFIVMSGSHGSLPLAGKCQGVEEPGQALGHYTARGEDHRP
jgi:hypothetical protein